MTGRIGFFMVFTLTLVTQRALARGPTPSTDEFPGNRYVKVRLVLEETALTPGKDGHVGVVFDIAKGWHLYWRNAGDSGLPPKVAFKLPPGVTVGTAQWPAPTRHVAPGELVDYVIEDRLVLIYPVSASEGVAVGKKVAISADVDWLVCSDRCVPGRATVKAELAVASSSVASGDGDLFAQARKRHPETGDSGPVGALYDVHWQGLDLVIGARNASRLTFFPYENKESVYPKDMYSRGVAKSNTLRLSYPAEARELKTIRGLLSITRGDKESYYELILPPPGR